MYLCRMVVGRIPFSCTRVPLRYLVGTLCKAGDSRRYRYAYRMVKKTRHYTGNIEWTALDRREYRAENAL